MQEFAFVLLLIIRMCRSHMPLQFDRDCPSAFVIYKYERYPIKYILTERHRLGKRPVSPGMCVDPSAHAQVMVIANNSC